MAKRTIRLNKSHEAIEDETRVEDSMDMVSMAVSLFKSGLGYDEAVRRYEAEYLSQDPDGSVFDRTWEELEDLT
jgi:hypothetical protein